MKKTQEKTQQKKMKEKSSFEELVLSLLDEYVAMINEKVDLPESYLSVCFENNVEAFEIGDLLEFSDKNKKEALDEAGRGLAVKHNINDLIGSIIVLTSPDNSVVACYGKAANETVMIKTHIFEINDNNYEHLTGEIGIDVPILAEKLDNFVEKTIILEDIIRSFKFNSIIKNVWTTK